MEKWKKNDDQGSVYVFHFSFFSPFIKKSLLLFCKIYTPDKKIMMKKMHNYYLFAIVCGMQNCSKISILRLDSFINQSLKSIQNFAVQT